MKEKNLFILRFIITFLFFFLGFISPIFWIIGYIIISYDLYIFLFHHLQKKMIFDENFLMILSSLGAIFLQDFKEALLIIWLYQLGEFIFDKTTNRSKEQIIRLLDLRVEKANVKEKNEIHSIDSKKVKKGNIIVIKPGEKIPLDGIVIKGESSLNCASLTGESKPKKVTIKDTVLSGSINLDSILEIRVTKNYQNSTASRILSAIEEASGRKAKSEKFITKFARIYTPIVLIGAILLTVIPVCCFHQRFSLWFYRSLIFLVASCPCALVISIPLCYFCGLGVASQNKILLKGASELEKLNTINTVVFDKTGTITQGNFKITKVIPYYKKRDDFIKYLAYAEYYSNHPIAKVIKQEYQRPINKEIISEYKEIAGKGISVKINGEHVLVGNETLFEQNHITYPKVKFLGTTVLVALNQEYIGTIVIADEIKECSYDIANKLKEVGIKNVIMMSGDKYDITKKVSERLRFDSFYANLLPEDKMKHIRNLKKDGKILFVGDGLNDAPVMVEADLSISMGNIGSDASIEASDIVIMNDNLNQIATGIKIAQQTKKIVMFNIIFSIFTKMIVMLLGSMGLLKIGFAVFADVGVTMIVILNSLRIFKQTY